MRSLKRSKGLVVKMGGLSQCLISGRALLHGTCLLYICVGQPAACLITNLVLVTCTLMGIAVSKTQINENNNQWDQ